MTSYFLPEKLYNFLKWFALIALPAIAFFYNTVAPGWGWPMVDQVVSTLNALAALIGVLIGASQLTSKTVEEEAEETEAA